MDDNLRSIEWIKDEYWRRVNSGEHFPEICVHYINSLEAQLYGLEADIKQETKEIINLSVASSGIIGYVDALACGDSVLPGYYERLTNHYIKNLQAAVKVFVDKLGE